MHQSEVERGRASDRLPARLSDVWKERDVDERSINDFGLVLMSRKEEKEEDSLEQRRHMAGLVGRPVIQETTLI